MCSLYHFIYAAASEEERESFIGSIKRRLKPDGSLVIVDNALVEDQTLPYHGPYIAKELVIRQLKHYGFTLVAAHQFIPQRYMLVFKLSGAGQHRTAHRTPATARTASPSTRPVSLVQFGKSATRSRLHARGTEGRTGLLPGARSPTTEMPRDGPRALPRT